VGDPRTGSSPHDHARNYAAPRLGRTVVVTCWRVVVALKGDVVFRCGSLGRRWTGRVGPGCCEDRDEGLYTGLGW